MLRYKISESEVITIKYLVLDYNGTIAIDGTLIGGVEKLLNQLSEKIEVHVITADTFGFAKEQLKNINCRVEIISNDSQDDSKSNYVKMLGFENTVAIGNGKNDIKMLKNSRLGICMIQEECAYSQTLISSDIVSRNIADALNLLLNPKKLKAVLRN